ncbi:MAG: DUF4249 domain-containing protein [Chitinophagales bacterium]
MLKQGCFQISVTYCSIAMLLLFASCTTNIELDLPEAEPKLVVEGSINAGGPPIVTLSRNASFFGEVNLKDFDQYFVNGANVWVYSNSDSVKLGEFCTASFPENVQRQLARSLGYSFSDTVQLPNICIYTIPEIIDLFQGDSSNAFLGEYRKSYSLKIEAEGKTLTSKTSIPAKPDVHSLGVIPHPDEKKDSLVSVTITFSVPDSGGNFIRYLTKRNNEPFYAPLSASVYSDKLFRGGTYTFPLEAGQNPNREIDWETYSYFWKGDTVKVKWSTIDKAHYDFWNTIENDGGDSPLSTPTRIKSNINGGLGIWGGYGAVYLSIIVPE